jgi:putative hydrolase of HD superfamily
MKPLHASTETPELDMVDALPAADGKRLRRQLAFMVEADKLKHTLRQTLLTDRSRKENSAEHSWHIALSVLVLSEYATDRGIDAWRVLKMLLVHDLVEIDAGDTYCYDETARRDQLQREEAAAERIFNLLPSDQARSMRRLWQEFERRETAESRFANALDRFQPFLHNYVTRGESWQEHGVHRDQVHSRMRPVQEGAPALWELVSRMLEEAVQRGYLADSSNAAATSERL